MITDGNEIVEEYTAHDPDPTSKASFSFLQLASGEFVAFSAWDEEVPDLSTLKRELDVVSGKTEGNA